MSTTVKNEDFRRARQADGRRLDAQLSDDGSALARLAEIDDEIDRAVAAGNRAKMEALVDELDSLLTEIDATR